jgi:hypothetical protein
MGKFKSGIESLRAKGRPNGGLPMIEVIVIIDSSIEECLRPQSN